MDAAIVIIGDEILLGRVTDTNSGAIARAVDMIGGRVVWVTTVGDNGKDISQAITQALDRADIVFTTGGLGPTKDDITKSVLTDIFGGKLVRDAAIIRNIEKIFEGRQLKLNELTLDQAIVPDSAHIIMNRLGTAPIMVFGRGDKTLIAMPGVPYETEGMLPEVIDHLNARYLHDGGSRHSTFVVTGLSESALAIVLADFENELGTGYKLAYLPDSPVIKLRLDGPEKDPDYTSVQSRLKDVLTNTAGLKILTCEDKTPGEAVVEKLAAKGLTLSTAESCTGGNIAHTITAVSGASAVFNGGVVSYANSAKINLLDVSKETLENYGAVSRQVVVQMADGVSRALMTDCAIATSGIAGPTGGTPEKPVGTVWIAVRTPRGTRTECFRLPGNRDRVIARATAQGLIMLLEELGEI